MLAARSCLRSRFELFFVLATQLRTYDLRLCGAFEADQPENSVALRFVIAVASTAPPVGSVSITRSCASRDASEHH